MALPVLLALVPACAPCKHGLTWKFVWGCLLLLVQNTALRRKHPGRTWNFACSILDAYQVSMGLKSFPNVGVQSGKLPQPSFLLVPMLHSWAWHLHLAVQYR
jgi:hypothetical protein